MNDIVRRFLGGKSAQEVLREEAATIQRIGDDHRVFTFDQREDAGYVTAESRAVAVQDNSPNSK
jgi:hypothetical protein